MSEEQTALARLEETPSSITPFTRPNIDVFRLANALARSGYFQDAKDEAQAVVKVLYGQELGIGPVAAMMGIYIEHGKPALHAGLIASIIKKSRLYNYRVRRLDDSGCDIEFFEKGEPVGISSFGKKDADAAGLTAKETYKKYPRNLYFARAISNGAKWFCADIFSGVVYTLEELDADDYQPRILETNNAELIARPVGVSVDGRAPLSAVPDQAPSPEESESWAQLGDEITESEQAAAPAEYPPDMEATLDEEILAIVKQMPKIKNPANALKIWIMEQFGVDDGLAGISAKHEDPIATKIRIRDQFKAELEAKK